MTESIDTEFEPGCFYHIYNRGNGSENIYFQDKNYIYFIQKYDKYLSGYLDTYAFCLLPNHFHFLIRIKDEDEILLAAKQDFPGFENQESLNVGKLVSERFRRFFMSYSKSINEQENRKGSVFKKYFRRKRVNSESYFTQLIFYIHYNPAHHGLFKDFENYPWSSYNRILTDKPTKLKKTEVLDWFGGKEKYIEFHQLEANFKNINSILFE